MEGYCDSCKEYIGLVKQPKLEKWMFDCSGYWSATFQAWNVIFFIGQVVLTVIYFLMNYQLFEHLSATTDGILSMLVSMLVMLFWTHLMWFCVTRACCGQPGYIVWAILIVLAFLGRLSALRLQGVSISLSLESLYFFVYALLIIPVFYMALSVCKLACGISPGKRGVALVAESDESDEELVDGASPATAVQPESNAPGAGRSPPVLANTTVTAPPTIAPMALPVSAYTSPPTASQYMPFMATSAPLYTGYAAPSSVMYSQQSATYAAPSSVVYSQQSAVRPPVTSYPVAAVPAGTVVRQG
eukprot:TRINITY_DN122191_c0_g1_i1.p1 TRINITY_DN122191_c0_g1~~TRINITY_DN122191_c0_g1_i1.p1  ORF type:complete len:301 (+),score=48.14 TRINITY_DN122191_c0_g1_i1:70-972(+)